MLEDMPDPKKYPQRELAGRLRDAMEDIDLSLTELAKGCGVTIQAVYDWRLTGRIGKRHLMTICRMTKKPLEYYLVGLGRAAMFLFACVIMLLQPHPAHASTHLNSAHPAYYVKWTTFSILHNVRNTHWMRTLRRLRLWLARVLELTYPSVFFTRTSQES